MNERREWSFEQKKMIHKDTKLTVEPLSLEESNWCHRMDKCLQDMPKRLYMVESGDSLLVVDREASTSVEMHDGGAEEAGIVLYTFKHGTFKVTSVSA